MAPAWRTIGAGRFARRRAVVDDQDILLADKVALGPIDVRLSLDDGDRRGEAEDAARAELAFHLDPTAEQVCEVAGDRQAKPRSAETAGNRCVGLSEGTEQAAI